MNRKQGDGSADVEATDTEASYADHFIDVESGEARYEHTLIMYNMVIYKMVTHNIATQHSLL